MGSPGKGRTYLLLTITAIIWGGAWPVGRLLTNRLALPAVSIIVVRYAIAIPLFFLWLRVQEGRIPIPTRRDRWPLVGMAVLSVTLYQLFFIYGVFFTAASDASLIIAFGPIMVALLSVRFLSEPMDRNRIWGLLVGGIGVALIWWLSTNTQIPLRDRLLGDALVFCGGFVYAVYTVWMRRYLRDTPLEERLSPLALLAWVSLIGWVILLPYTVVERPWEYDWEVIAWINIAYLAILSTVVAYGFYAIGVQRIGATRSAIFVNLVPVFGVLSSWFILGERIGWVHLVSFVLVYAGVILINRTPPHDPADEE